MTFLKFNQRLRQITKLVLLLQVIWVQASGQVQHVEPLNWFVGMKNPALQLLVHGKAIGETSPQVDYPGVRITRVTPGDSKNYLFIDLHIAPNTKPGKVPIRFRKNGAVVETVQYALLARQQDAQSFKGFTATDAVYLLVPDRFVNGDESNDVVAGTREQKIDRSFPGGRHGGDIRGIINSLDYIRDMGFTAIWPTPMLENNMPAYSYHGYSITNHYQVDPRYGSLEEYKELSAKARQKGIKLIFDEVLNHIGSHYWWMDDLPFKDWLNFPGEYVQSNHRRTTNQDRYASQYDKDLMTKGWFDKTMPDMNGQQPFVARYLIQNTIWWIETLQLGGVRQDTYGYSDKKLLEDWSCAIMTEYPNFSIVGEEWSVNPLIASYWQKGWKKHDGYEGCLNTVMDFPLQSALVLSLLGSEAEYYHSAFTRLYEALANDFVYPNPNQLLIFGDNHDMDRLFMQLNQDVALTQMALTYLFTIRGIPQVFYGTEILMDNTGHHKVDGLIRSDFPGGWKGDSVNAFTGKGLSEAQRSTQVLVRKLLQWRKSSPVVAAGKTLHFAPFDGIYVYFRYTNEQTVMVVMNLNKTTSRIGTGRFAEILGGKTTARNVLTGETVDIKGDLLVPGVTATVFEISK